MAEDYKLIDNEEKHRYEFQIDGKIAEIDYSLPPRRCLLCEQSAAVCARGKTHQLTDLLNRMEALLNDVDACNVN